MATARDESECSLDISGTVHAPCVEARNAHGPKLGRPMALASDAAVSKSGGRHIAGLAHLQFCTICSCGAGSINEEILDTRMFVNMNVNISYAWKILRTRSF